MTYLTGFHAIEERIKSSKTEGVSCGPLLVAKAGPRAKEIESLAINSKIRIERIGTFELDGLAPNNRGIALRIEGKGYGASPRACDITLDDFLIGLQERSQSNALVLIIDEITDPHNYGAILRCCDQFAVDLVINRTRRSAKHAAIIAQTSAGAVSWVTQTEAPNLARAVDDLKEAGFWIYGADMEGDSIYNVNLSGRTAFILGSEGSGISRLLRERCDKMIGIPSLGKIDSLNVSVAAGILLYEARRRYTINNT